VNSWLCNINQKDNYRRKKTMTLKESLIMQSILGKGTMTLTSKQYHGVHDSSKENSLARNWRESHQYICCLDVWEESEMTALKIVLKAIGIFT
jgi:hypothetical protein